MNWSDPYVLSLLGFVAVISIGAGLLRRHRPLLVAEDTIGSLLLVGAFLYARQIGSEAGALVGVGAVGMYLVSDGINRTRTPPSAAALG